MRSDADSSEKVIIGVENVGREVTHTFFTSYIKYNAPSLPPPSPLCDVMSSSHRGAEAAGEQDAHGGVVSDEEQEGVVCDEGGRTKCAAQHHDGGGGGGCLGSLLVHLHEGLVDDLGQAEVVGRRHACGREDNVVSKHEM